MYFRVKNTIKRANRIQFRKIGIIVIGGQTYLTGRKCKCYHIKGSFINSIYNFLRKTRNGDGAWFLLALSLEDLAMESVTWLDKIEDLNSIV